MSMPFFNKKYTENITHDNTSTVITDYKLILPNNCNVIVIQWNMLDGVVAVVLSQSRSL